MKNNICKVLGCTRKIHAKGYCGAHYNQILKYGEIKREYVRNRKNDYETKGEYAEIILRNINGEETARAIIDVADIEIASRYTWSLNTNGYVRCNCGGKIIYLHSVIAAEKISNEKWYKEVNHKDEDKLNNTAENLEWCDHKYNCNYGTRIIRCSDKNKKPVKQIDHFGNIVAKYSGVADATRNMGLRSRSAITNCISGISKSCCGFKWEYV